MRRKTKQREALFLAAAVAAGILAGCGSSGGTESSSAAQGTSAASPSAQTGSTETSASSSAGGEKVLTIGSGQATASGMDPVVDYDGWYALRYGIGQTLTRMNDDMSISGWLVNDDFSSNDDYTEWTFTIRDMFA